MHTEVLSYEADGVLMQSHLYFEGDATGRPGILVFPEAFGLSQHAKTQAERLAGVGYITLACDLHGEGKLFADLKSVSGILEGLRNEPAHIRARAKGGLDALVALPEVDSSRIAAIGYCFGGTMALELARGGAQIAAVVGFHSGLATVAPQDARNIKGQVLVCIGADDPVIPLEQRIDFEKEMRNGGVDWQMNVYGGVVHSFTNPDADKAGRTEVHAMTRKLPLARGQRCARFWKKYLSDRARSQEPLNPEAKQTDRLPDCKVANYLRIWAAPRKLSANGSTLFANGESRSFMICGWDGNLFTRSKTVAGSAADEVSRSGL